MAIPATQSVVLNAVAPRYIGKASGAYNTMRQLGGAFGVAVVVAVFSAVGSYATPARFSDGFVVALGISAAIAAVGTVVGLGLPRRRAAAPEPEPEPEPAPAPVPALAEA